MARKKREGSILGKIYYWFVGYRSRHDYWTCGKFADWIRKHTGVDPKPHAATAEEWCEWHGNNDHKLGSKIADEWLDVLQDIWMFIPDVYHRVSVYVRNRYIDKPHYLDTKLTKGEWHEFDTRLVHGMFEALVTFVEDEKASMQRWTSDEKFKLPNAEKGIQYLEWEMTLGEEKPDDPDYHPMPEQAARAKETLEIYYWWKNERPKRKEPGEAVGLWAFHDKHRNDEDGFWCMMSHKFEGEDKKEYHRLLDLSNEEETRQYNEDTEMMIRLVKLRNALWT